MGVTITYAGSEIASMDAAGTKTLETQGKYCTDDITVAYSPSAPSYTVTITLNNPTAPSSFVSCKIYESNNTTAGNEIGEILSPTGSATVTTTTGGIAILMQGDYVAPSLGTYDYNMDPTIGVALVDEGSTARIILAVAGDGEINIYNIDWSD